MLTTLRPAIRCLFWCFVALFCACTNIAVVFTNYLALKGSFELLGFEPKPLSADELWGDWIGLFAPNATICDFSSAAVAMTVFLGVFIAAHLAARIFERWRDQAIYRVRGDEASAAAASMLMRIDAVLLALFLVPLGLAAAWDIDLFRYRSVAGAQGFDDSAVATRGIQDWSSELVANGHYFAWTIAAFGPYGYLAATALAALALDFAFMKVGENWESLWAPADGEGEENEDESEFVDQEANEAAGNGQPSAFGPEVAAESTATPLFSGGPAADNRPQHGPEPTVSVVGRPGEEVTRATAMANPDRYQVDHETGQVWDRTWWELANAQDLEEAAK